MNEGPEGTSIVSIVVNGEPRIVRRGTTLAQLVSQLAGEPRGVAVAIDREVVPRATWADRTIEEGANVEVVTAVAGG
jgi:sulfur carrier protein